MTLGARRVPVERPRVRSADGRSELPLEMYGHFADRDPLTTAVLERMLAGVSTRRYRRIQEPVGEAVEAEARRTHDRPVPDRGGDYPRQCLTVIPGPPSRSSTTSGTSSPRARRASSRRWSGRSAQPAATAHEQHTRIIDRLQSRFERAANKCRSSAAHAEAGDHAGRV